MKRKRVNDVLKIEDFLEHYFSCVLAWPNNEKETRKQSLTNCQTTSKRGFVT